MDPQVSTSFIPKKNLESASAASQGLGKGTGLVLLVAALIFITSLVAAGGVFLYENLLKQSIISKSESLKLNEKAYDPGVIQELSRADLRINEAKKLLEKHVAPSPIFSFLGQQTLEKVQFVEFSLSIEGSGENKLSLKGIADSFSTVALQSRQFGASKTLKDVVFSGVGGDASTGKISFIVSATVDPTLTLYSNALIANPATPIEQSTVQDTGGVQP